LWFLEGSQQMFTRTKPEAEERGAADDLAIPLRPTPPVQQPRMPPPARPPVMPPRGSDAAVAEAARRVGDTQPQRNEGDVRRLVVGREITLSGTITRCDQLVVEGSVEANLNDCRDIDIAESGCFKGSATIEQAEIRGRFEGDLNVRKRLLIKATGRVVGKIRYGQLEIECGGQIIGEVQAGSDADASMATAAE
jgi:cytoskeletal protein CcmA (bactofilin family)